MDTFEEQAGVRLPPNGMLDLTPLASAFQSITKRNTKESPLLRLPAAIRSQIFGDVYGGHTIYLSSQPAKDSRKSGIAVLRDSHSPDTPTKSVFLPDTPIASVFSPLQQVCRQIHAETALLPFSTVNSFWYYSKKDQDVCLPEIYEPQVQSSGHIFFLISFSEEYLGPLGSLDLKRLEGLELFQGLKKVALFPDLEGMHLSLEQVDDMLKGLRIVTEEPLRKVTPEGMEIMYSILRWGSVHGRSLRSGSGGCFFHA